MKSKIVAVLLALSTTRAFAQDTTLWNAERSQFYPVIMATLLRSPERKLNAPAFELQADAATGFVFTMAQTGWKLWTGLDDNNAGLVLDNDGFRTLIKLRRYKDLESRLKEEIQYGHGYRAIVLMDHHFHGSTQVTRIVKCQKLKGDVHVDEYRFIPNDADGGIVVEFTIFDFPPHEKSITEWRKHMDSHYAVYEAVYQKVVSEITPRKVK